MDVVALMNFVLFSCSSGSDANQEQEEHSPGAALLSLIRGNEKVFLWESVAFLACGCASNSSGKDFFKARHLWTFSIVLHFSAVRVDTII